MTGLTGSAPQKGVMISHMNGIANTLQKVAYHKPVRDAKGEGHRDVILGLLPQSHIFSLFVVCHHAVYQGDSVIILPRYDIQQLLSTIANHRINILYIVPPIMLAMVKNKPLMDRFDLSSITHVNVGAAPLGPGTIATIQQQHPNWMIANGYGLTECCTISGTRLPDHVWHGSLGTLIPEVECRLVSEDGHEITQYDEPGEVFVKSPSLVLGYLNNPEATAETFVTDEEGRRWMKTGDQAVMRKSPDGDEHLWIVDRIKELIKVKVKLSPQYFVPALLIFTI